jgi:asparagine synthase (glutamine-hydrolysing)
MCGIAFAFTPQQATRVAVMQAMCHTMRHRGPDDEGYLLWDVQAGTTPLRLGGSDTPTAVFDTPTLWQPQGRVEDQAQRAATLLMGHRRLAIVDLSPWGHQPMVRGAAQWVVFNGEIYNHLELRVELEALGQAFVGHSDTEVLLAALAQWGHAALQRFNGMWAMVVLDMQRRRVFIARDRFGVKPLYMWQGAGGALLLASEIKALLVHPLVRAAAATSRCVDFVQHGPQAWRAETEFEGITRFPAGHWAEFNLDAPAPLQPQAFWQAPHSDDAHAPFDATRNKRHADEYAQLLGDAVRLRMRADVRVGTALSGGLDSSSIAVLVNAQLRAQGVQDQQEVFSSVYTQPDTRAADESAFIAQVARQLDVRSNLIEPVAADVPAAHQQMIWALDTPPQGTLMSSWHTFALVAQRGVVVTLDGQGADEQLAGYSRYVRNLLAHAPVPQALRQARALLTGMQGFGSAVAVGLAAQALRRVGGVSAVAAAARALRMGADPSPTLPQALHQDFSTHLQNLLMYGDKTSMAWSVESRMPFMDYRLVQFLAELPVAYKLHDGWTKWLARDAMRGQLPASVLWRRDKLGWAIPEATWFAGSLSTWLTSELSQSAFVQDMAQRAGVRITHANLTQRLRLLNLAVWHRLYFEEPQRPGRVLGKVQTP